MSVTIYKDIKMMVHEHGAAKLNEVLETRGLKSRISKRWWRPNITKLHGEVIYCIFEGSVLSEDFEWLVGYLKNNFPYHVSIHV